MLWTSKKMRMMIVSRMKLTSKNMQKQRLETLGIGGRYHRKR